MENVIHRLALDLTGPDMCPTVEVQRGDSARSLIITLTQGGRPYWIDEGLTAALFATKPDGNPLFNACTIEKNRIRYDFTPQTANVAGAFDCEIWLVAGDKREMTTPKFTIAVDERMRTDDVIPESEPEYTAITEMVAAGTAMIEELRKALAGLEGVEEILTQARAAAEAASNSEAAARGHAKTAAKAAEDALTLAAQANSASQQSNKYAFEALQHRQAAEAAAARAEEAAANPGQGDGNGSGQNVDLTGYAEKTWVQEGFQPKGNYLTSAPVTAVNGKTGAVQLSAEDVGARPNTWTPTAQEVRALPDTYTPPNQTAEQVGADPKGTAASAVAEHNTAADAHNDIRVKLEELRQTLAHFFNATTPETMDQISELVSGIEANADLIAALTTGKVSVSSIVANLTTNLADRPLAASMGVELKKLIDQVSASLANYQPKGNYALASDVPTKVSQLANDKGYLTEHQDISGKADKFDPTVYGLPVLRLTGDTAPIAVSKDNKVTVDYAWGERSGTAKLKGQGATSYKIAQALVQAGKAGKFNYTITFDEAFEAFPGWGMQKKYCLKANWIDPTQSRNICSCKLWGMSTKARSVVPPELANLPNGGAIDGFPIIIMLNGEFHGLYTWNIPKDGWMCGLVEDPTKTQAIVSASDHTAATQFKEASMSGFEVEFVSDENNADWVEQSLTRMISAVINSDGSDLDTTVAQYLDWDSWIDHLIHTVVDKATDCVDKNYNLVTFDGVKWYVSAYDRDSIYGLEWDASGLTRPVSNCSFTECAATVRVYELILRFKTNRLKARYKELRGNILSESRIMQVIENFAWVIPSPVKQEDVKKYPTILGSDVNTIDQIGRFVRQRLETSDKWVDALPAQEEPPAPEPDEPEQPAEMVNQVPISTDTDGSIYNGVGYKDNARLSSSGGVSSSAQTGSVVTGFIPYAKDAVIRTKGAEWLNMSTEHSGHHFYMSFYDSSKTLLNEGYVSAETYAGGTTGTWIAYDEATGVTMFDTSGASTATTGFLSRIANAAYFRINAYGRGADLIVTVNQEITG